MGYGADDHRRDQEEPVAGRRERRHRRGLFVAGERRGALQGVALPLSPGGRGPGRGGIYLNAGNAATAPICPAMCSCGAGLFMTVRIFRLSTPSSSTLMRNTAMALNFSSGEYQIVIVLVSPSVWTLATMYEVFSCIHGFLRAANDVVITGSPSSSSVT